MIKKYLWMFQISLGFKLNKIDDNNFSQLLTKISFLVFNYFSLHKNFFLIIKFR